MCNGLELYEREDKAARPTDRSQVVQPGQALLAVAAEGHVLTGAKTFITGGVHAG